MGSKNVSLKEETYHRLARTKGDGESFSDVIDRLLDAEDQPLTELIGLLEPAEAETVRERSRAFRGEIDGRLGSEAQR